MIPDAPAGRTAMLGAALVAAVTVFLLWALAGAHAPGAFDRTLFGHLHGRPGDAGVGFARRLTKIGDGAPLIAVLTVLGLGARARWRTWSPLFVTGGAVGVCAACLAVVMWPLLLTRAMSFGPAARRATVS